MSRGRSRLTTLALLLTSLSTAPATSEAAVRLGVLAGTQLTTVRGDDILSPADRSWSWNGYAGVRMEGPIGAGLSWSVEPHYQPVADRREYAVTFPGTGGPLVVRWDVTDVVHTIAIPVRVDAHRGWLRAGLGPGARILLHATSDIGPPDLPLSTSVRRPVPMAKIFEELGTRGGRLDVTESHLGMQLTAEGMLGAAIPAGRHEGRVEFRWSEGVTRSRVDARYPARWRAVQTGLAFLW